MSQRIVFYLNLVLFILLSGFINVISAQPLSAPTLISPVNWATIDSLLPTFRWDQVTGALTYHIQLSSGRYFQQNIIDSATVTQTQFTSAVLATGTTYFWRVRAANSSHTSPWSLIFRLRINGINLADRLVAYYPFDGNPEDSIGTGDGTLQGDVTLAPDRYRKPDHAYSFDGNGDHITLPETQAFTAIDREITVSAWVLPKSLAFETGIIHRDRFWRLFFYSDGSVVGNIFNENGSENRIESSNKAALDRWSHVAFSYDRQYIHVYLNGEQCGQLEYPVARIGQQNASSTPVIGRGFGLSQNDFDGVIDDVRIYDRALTVAEMAELYRDKEPPATPMLISPENGTVNDVSLFQALYWHQIWNASSFYVQLSSQQDFSALVYEDSTLTNNVVVVGPLTANQKYYWRVRAKNATGTSSWSTVRYFTIAEGVGTVYFNDIDPDKIILGNNFYELTLQKSTGAISNIVDKTAGRIISEGTSEKHLWGATFVDGDQWDYSFFDSAEDTVNYYWNLNTKTLTFSYSPNTLKTRDVSALVFFKLSEDYYFDIQIELQNNSGVYLYAVDLPYRLEMEADKIEEAILPLMPGAKLKKKYFEERRSGNIGWYPTALVFADYIYFKVNSGQYGMYTVLEQDITPNVERSLNAPETGSNNYRWMHAYQIGLPNELSWTSPLLRCCVGQDELQTAAGYRNDTGLNNFASIQEKLGDDYEPISQSIWNQIGIADLFRGSGLKLTDREAYNRIWNLLPSPSILFIVGWETGLGGSDATAPDVFPVDPRLGTDADLRIVLEDARQAGHLVMPYINTTIWNVNSPTVQSHQPGDFARFDINGNPVHEYYNDNDCYSTCPYAPTVINRIQKVFADLQEKMPINLVFEDQIGPRGGLDYTPLSPTPAHYPQGWLEHTQRYQDYGLTTEFGYDRLIETHLTFLGNLVLWDRNILPNSTWGGYCDKEWGSGNWEYFPLVPIMAGDKIIFQSMSADSPTNNKPILTWDMAMKQMLGYFSVSDDAFDHIWRNTATSFQKYVISRYFHERMLDYTYTGTDVTKSRFTTHEVLTNWSKTNTLAAQNHLITTEGFMVTSTAGNLIAGIFTNYNGLDLSSGDHYIIETRYPDSLVVRYPQGNDTPVRLDHRSLGPGLDRYCYAFIDNRVLRLPASVDSQYIHFNLNRYYDTAEVDRYLITAKPVYLSAPILTEPGNWTTVQEHQTTLKWEKVAGATHYLVQIANEDTFRISIVDSVTTTGIEFTSNKLEKGTTYFWRVRARNASQTGAWSGIYRFRVDGINISDRLVAHYPLDGNADDAIGNSDGTLMGDVVIAPDRFGNVDQAYSFDGNDDYIAFSETKVFTSIDRQITVSTWIRPTSLAFETGVMLREQFWYMFLNSDGSLFGLIFNESGEQRRVGSSAKAPLAAWSLVAFTYDGQTINVYLNGRHSGALEFPIARIGPEGEWSTPLLGHGFGNSQNDFHGIIDEVRVYDRALTREEMAELYRKTATENFPPQITAFSPTIDTTIIEGASIEFSVAFQDEDDDRLVSTWSYDHTTIATDTTNNDSAAIVINFPFGSVGSHSVKVSISDGELSVTKIWNITVHKKAAPELMVHYLPWYQAKPNRDYWGWHWTMNHFNPDHIDAIGKREIASHYYPLTGPYDSNDKNVLEYQVLLMKLSGIDGVIADWYGSDDFWDYGLINESTASIFNYAEKAGLAVAVCYEDRTIKNMIAENHITAPQAIAQAQQEMIYLEQNWFSKANYLKLDQQPVFLVFGPHYFFKSSEWNTIFSVLPTAPKFFTLDNALDTVAAGAYPWPPMWQAVAGVLSEASLNEYLTNFYQTSKNWSNLVAGAFPGFNDIYEEAGLGFTYGWLDAKNGATFRSTLQRAIDNHPDIIQIITWNDFGEGTTIEPTLEYEYQYLEAIQTIKKTAIDSTFHYSLPDLFIPLEIYNLRKTFIEDPTVNTLLDQVFDLIIADNLDSAVAIIDHIKTITTTPAEAETIPAEYSLAQNYPNPFNPITHIRFGLPKAGKVKIVLYNIRGEKVKTILDLQMNAGYHSVTIDGSELSSGIYFYRIQAGEFLEHKKMILLR